jgi:hypothetical protein
LLFFGKCVANLYTPQLHTPIRALQHLYDFNVLMLIVNVKECIQH